MNSISNQAIVTLLKHAVDGSLPFGFLLNSKPTDIVQCIPSSKEIMSPAFVKMSMDLVKTLCINQNQEPQHNEKKIELDGIYFIVFTKNERVILDKYLKSDDLMRILQDINIYIINLDEIRGEILNYRLINNSLRLVSSTNVPNTVAEEYLSFIKKNKKQIVIADISMFLHSKIMIPGQEYIICD